MKPSLLDKYVSETENPEDFANWQELKAFMMDQFHHVEHQPNTLKHAREILFDVLELLNTYKSKNANLAIKHIFEVIWIMNDVLELFELAANSNDPDDFELGTLEVFAYDHSQYAAPHRAYFER